jgi:hypothetical protein
MCNDGPPGSLITVEIKAIARFDCCSFSAAMAPFQYLGCKQNLGHPVNDPF